MRYTRSILSTLLFTVAVVLAGVRIFSLQWLVLVVGYITAAMVWRPRRAVKDRRS